MIKINSANDFELLFDRTFGDIDRSTLSKVKDQKLRIILGGEDDDEAQRLEQAFVRSTNLLQYCFNRKSIWLRIILWSDKEEKNLEKAGFKFYRANNIIRQKKEEEILYLHFKHYSKMLFSPITKSIVNLDMAKDPSANITCYFISFNSKLIVNIYDDRGMDIYTPNKDLLIKIKNEFFNWCI